MEERAKRRKEQPRESGLTPTLHQSLFALALHVRLRRGAVHSYSTPSLAALVSLNRTASRGETLRRNSRMQILREAHPPRFLRATHAFGKTLKTKPQEFVLFGGRDLGAGAGVGSAPPKYHFGAMIWDGEQGARMRAGRSVLEYMTGRESSAATPLSAQSIRQNKKGTVLKLSSKTVLIIYDGGRKFLWLHCDIFVR